MIKKYDRLHPWVKDWSALHFNVNEMIFACEMLNELYPEYTWVQTAEYNGQTQKEYCLLNGYPPRNSGKPIVDLGCTEKALGRTSVNEIVNNTMKLIDD